MLLHYHFSSSAHEQIFCLWFSQVLLELSCSLMILNIPCWSVPAIALSSKCLLSVDLYNFKTKEQASQLVYLNELNEHPYFLYNLQECYKKDRTSSENVTHPLTNCSFTVESELLSWRMVIFTKALCNITKFRWSI